MDYEDDNDDYTVVRYGNMTEGNDGKLHFENIKTAHKRPIPHSPSLEAETNRTMTGDWPPLPVRDRQDSSDSTHPQGEGRSCRGKHMDHSQPIQRHRCNSSDLQRHDVPVRIYVHLRSELTSTTDDYYYWRAPKRRFIREHQPKVTGEWWQEKDQRSLNAPHRMRLLNNLQLKKKISPKWYASFIKSSKQHMI